MIRIKGFLWRAGVNGCGVLGVKPPFWRKYRDCCALHDALYDDGGCSTERFRADKRLLCDMLARSHSAWMVMWCIVYYITVRAIGWMFFNYKN